MLGLYYLSPVNFSSLFRKEILDISLAVSLSLFKITWNPQLVLRIFNNLHHLDFKYSLFAAKVKSLKNAIKFHKQWLKCFSEAEV